MKTFSIEGNIGSGKSTLIELLKLHLPLQFLDEPVKVWDTIRDSFGVTILEKYYQDPKRYAFSFQMMAYITRLSAMRKAKGEILFTERSIYTDREIFAKMLYDSGKIEPIEYSIYLNWFNEFLDDINIDGLIYVYTPPELCVNRINQRSRKGEESIPLEYIKQCNDYHENWIKNTNIPVLYIDGTKNYSIETIETIKKFIR
jgi:deoxyadenosine/deoxycytidine kinase